MFIEKGTGRFVSSRVRDIRPSGIRAFFDLNAAGGDTIALGVGEPDFVTPEKVREACIQALHEGQTKYTSNAGLIELREEISAYFSGSFALSYDPEHEMIVTVGSSEAVDLALRAVIDPGDEVLIPAPSYIAYEPITHLHGGKIVEVAATAEEQFKLTPQALQAAITPHSKVLMINYPCNPTGTVMTKQDWLPITELIIKHNLVVISDEVYAELTYGRKHVSIASLPGMKKRTIVISGFSKAFAMTGWRVGYACGPRELIAGMLKIHQYTAMCAPTIAQIAALESLRHGLAAKDEMMASYNERRKLFVAGLNAIGLACHEPEGAFYAFPSITSTGMSSEQFALRMLKEAKVAVVPGHVFGSGGEGFIRCSYATSLVDLEKALERMERFMQVMQPV
ncbi:aminotransferase class I/II-fold pyridoxal phosphate-dependent enzyme [Paenibacillus polymyxa]|uniref:Aminotransferase n=1 Tax=Paenibacillus polymyxa TaxID=1406 RepID=A0A8I1IZ03_PAEPO|nr:MULTISPECIES: aminotransferase class I/II-fold pyridoxal phosphate-dependent enzyme [Paenibacillus]KAF6574227.1 aminotransferase class I/II-fold pyridoxal phosphate-dependent enzyme [Paenibacillus sp. EKM206P]KAF6588698.1 aminotransferase class I/II-fold pyridoxal phosphate-dependent enzyme [Paenibacillus sp. EKM205P]MBM0632895.1 aminotransferase class I/II-fold pyridoxal phosphate-dependent enzyme [Paenibacillus polymyxa]